MPKLYATASHALHEAATMRRKSAGFKNIPDYILSLVRYDVACNVPHRHSAGWDKLSPAERDAIDKSLLEGLQRNERPMTSRTKTRCYEILARLMGPLAPSQEEFMKMVEAAEKADANGRGE